MYEEMIETSFLKILLKSFHENYSDMFIKLTQYVIGLKNTNDKELAKSPKIGKTLKNWEN